MKTLRWMTRLLMLAAAPALALAEAPHLSLEVDLDPNDQAVTVAAELHLVGREAIQLHLPPRSTMTELRRDGEALPLTSSPAFPVGGLNPGGSTVTVRYHAHLPSLEELDDTWRPFLGESGVFLPAGGGWHPRVSGVTLLTHEVTIRTPDGWRAVASGEWVDDSDDGTVARYRHPRPGRGVTVVAGPWRVETQSLEHGLTVRTYLTEGTAHLAETYLEPTGDYLLDYHRRIGGAPFSSFAVVAAPIPVGVAFPGFTWIGESVLALPFIPYTSLPHEVLHNWWGATVHVDYGDGNWSEGLTTWMADHWHAERRDPAEARRVRGDWLRNHAALPPQEDYPLRRFRGGREGAHRVVGYQRGAMLFHMLRDRLGEEAFDEGIRRFWEARAFRVTRWAHLQAAFEAASGDDLAVYFDQWLHRTGAPRLRLERAERTEDGVVIRLFQATPAYELHVPVAVETEHGTERFTLFLAGTQAEAHWTVEGTPTAVAVDPDYDLYRALDPGERIPVIREVLEAASIHVAGPLGREAARQLRLEHPGATLERAGAVLVAAERDEMERVLRAVEALPAPMPPPDAAAVAWAGRDARDRPLVVITGDDREAVQGLLRRLSHHARESHVAWDGERVIDSGLWPEPEHHGLRLAF